MADRLNMPDQYDWEGQDVVLQDQRPVAVYRTRWGGITIRQQSAVVDEWDDEISVTPLGAVQLAWRLIETANWVGLPRPPRELMGSVDVGPSAPLADGASDSKSDSPSRNRCLSGAGQPGLENESGRASERLCKGGAS